MEQAVAIMSGAATLDGGHGHASSREGGEEHDPGLGVITVAGEALIDLIVDPAGRIDPSFGGGPFNVVAPSPGSGCRRPSWAGCPATASAG